MTSNDGVPLGLAVGVSVGAISFVVVIFLILFMFWKRKYPAHTQIERGEDGAGTYIMQFFSLHCDLLLTVRNSKGMILHKIWIITLSWEQGLTKPILWCQTGSTFKVVGFLCFKAFYGSAFKVSLVLEIRLKS